MFKQILVLFLVAFASVEMQVCWFLFLFFLWLKILLNSTVFFSLIKRPTTAAPIDDYWPMDSAPWEPVRITFETIHLFFILIIFQISKVFINNITVNYLLFTLADQWPSGPYIPETNTEFCVCLRCRNYQRYWQLHRRKCLSKFL